MLAGGDADVLIVGAGPSGVLATLALARRGQRVLLLDKAAEARDKPCGEGLMPLGGSLLAELGLDLGRLGYPALEGVRYRLADRRSVAGRFRALAGAGPGYGVRRLRFNADLMAAAAAAPGVRLELACLCRLGDLGPDRVSLETDRGRLTGGALIAADGLRSGLARQLGWSRPPRPPHRFGLVGHLDVPGHVQSEICVTLLEGVEVYTAPAGGGQLLAAVLGPRQRLVPAGEPVAAAYRAAVEQAHPELAGAGIDRVRGAGPFHRRPATVSRGRAFLIGDAAGFIDPLTGDAMAAGMEAAAELARLLALDPSSAAARYSAWQARQWRRRRLLTALALSLTGGGRRAARALAGVGRHPAALESLLEVNGGLRPLRRVRLRDWAALAGL